MDPSDPCHRRFKRFYWCTSATLESAITQRQYYCHGCASAVSEEAYSAINSVGELNLPETEACARSNDAACLALNRSCLWNVCGWYCGSIYERYVTCRLTNKSMSHGTGCHFNCNMSGVDRNNDSVPLLGFGDASCRPTDPVMSWMLVAVLWFFLAR